jgi:CheY-like chemotaxis protein
MSDGAAPRLLAIDDEPTMCQIFTRALRSIARVTTASNVADAAALLEQQTFDVVICDVNMPAGGGPAVRDHIERLQPALLERTLYVTGGGHVGRQGRLRRVDPRSPPREAVHGARSPGRGAGAGEHPAAVTAPPDLPGDSPVGCDAAAGLMQPTGMDDDDLAPPAAERAPRCPGLCQPRHRRGVRGVPRDAGPAVGHVPVTAPRPRAR